MNFFKSFRTFDEILPDFLDDVRIQIKHKSYLGYTGKTSVFGQWLKDNNLSNTPLKKISKYDMEKFFKYVANEKPNGRKDEEGNILYGLDRPTCDKYREVLNRLYVFAQKRGDVDSFPFELITLPRKKDDMSAAVIPIEHLVLITDEMARRDRQLHLAFMTEFYCWSRPGNELRLLRVGNVKIWAEQVDGKEVYNGTIEIVPEHSKVGRRRILTMPIQLIKLYLEHKICDFPKEFFIFGNRHQPGLVPVSINMFRYRFNQIRDDLNMPKKYKFYSGKHSGMTMLHDNNMVSLFDIMQQAGHSKLTSTQHYFKTHGSGINTKIRDSFPNPFAQSPTIP